MKDVRLGGSQTVLGFVRSADQDILTDGWAGTSVEFVGQVHSR